MWTQAKGRIQSKWDKLSTYDLELIAGRRDRLETKIRHLAVSLWPILRIASAHVAGVGKCAQHLTRPHGAKQQSAVSTPITCPSFWPHIGPTPPFWPRPYRILFPRKAPLFLRGFLIEPPTSDAGASGDNHSGDMGDSRRNGDGSKGDSSRNTGGNSRSGRDNTHTHNTDNAVRY
jgi:hypothetical protein